MDKNILASTIRLSSKKSSTRDINENALVIKGGASIKGDLTVLGKLNIPQLEQSNVSEDVIRTIVKEELKNKPDTLIRTIVKEELKNKPVVKEKPTLANYVNLKGQESLNGNILERLKLLENKQYPKSNSTDQNVLQRLTLLENKQPGYNILKRLTLLEKRTDHSISDRLTKLETKKSETRNIDTNLLVGNNFFSIYPDTKSVYINGDLHVKNIISEELNDKALDIDVIPKQNESLGNPDNYWNELYSTKAFLDVLAVNSTSYFDGSIFIRPDEYETNVLDVKSREKSVFHINTTTGNIGFGTDKPAYPVDFQTQVNYQNNICYSYEKVKSSENKISVNKTVTAITIDKRGSLFLEDGKCNGQLKIINILSVYPRTALYLKVKNFVLDRKIQFSSKGQSVELLWCDGVWMVKNSFGIKNLS